ncbi:MULTISPECIES: glycosyltransferase [unclassified Phaeobacter]|uniref:glycosyltransferase n=1 Tax=unclassified Phaeobacter TaxID=2621772 RepID=UPI003A86B947
MDIRLSIVGLVRFSVLTPTYYSEKFATLADTAAHLFAPDRMELRFRVFERLCLRSLLRQSDQGFHLIVLTAEDMPEPYLERLSRLLEPADNITLMPVGPGVHYKMLKQGYNAVPTEGATHRLMFRLDDDDAVDLDYIARNRRLATGMIPLQGESTPFILANNRGIYLRRREGPEGVQDEIFDACEKAPLSVGAALVAPVGYGGNPYRYNHRRYAQHWNVVSDISTPGFLRTIHGDNKSRPAQMGITHKMSEAEIAAALDRHFAMTPDQLRAVLP